MVKQSINVNMGKAAAYGLMLCIIFIGMGCETSNIDKIEKSEKKGVKVASVLNGKISASVSDAELKTLAIKGFNEGMLKSKLETSFFENAHIEGSGEHYYLIAKGQDTKGNSIAVATELVVPSQVALNSNKKNNEFTLMYVKKKKKHKCSGVKCSSCGFTYEKGEIDGCNCDRGRGGSYCNHTVISG